MIHIYIPPIDTAGFGRRSSPILDILRRKNSRLKEYVKITDMESSDLFVFPFSTDQAWENRKSKVYLEYIEQARDLKKKVLLFTGGDIGKTIRGDHVFTYRLGGFDSKMSSGTFIMPPFIKDPYVFLNKAFEPLEKTEKPTIGFVGHANQGIRKYGEEFLIHLRYVVSRLSKNLNVDYQSFYPSSIFRYKTLQQIQNDDRIIDNFIFRSKYRAGVRSEEERKRTSLEFYENMNQNLYTFCMRGGGNFSVRLYETLAMGRIPVLLNTDCRLPFSDEINWKEHCVIVEDKNVDNLNDVIIEFHSATSMRLQEIQKSNRELWRKYLAKENYFIELSRVLEKYL